LPIVFIGYWVLPSRFRNYFLLLASYYFYFTYDPWFLLLLIGTSAFDYWCAKKIEAVPTRKKLFLYLSVVSNVGVLAAFKYWAFLFNSGISATNYLGGTNYSLMDELIIPAGLSFYTLQSLSYTIDVYRGKYKPSDTLYEFLLYVSFFPHMVAGPVVRYNTLMPQLKIVSYFKQIDWASFAQLTIWGYFKKMVIADNISDVVSQVFNYPHYYNGMQLLMAGALFVVQVYCDFSGYSDIATGISKLFNINLSLNWRRPLLSTSLHEFWTRNHISITTWFRDYLYIGLGGNRVSYKRWLTNIFLVFVISGLWHGANLTFLIWGSMHGIMYIIEILFKKKFPLFKAPNIVGWIYLLSFHTISLIAFRAANVHDLGYIYRHIFSPEVFDIQTYCFNDRFQLIMIILLVAFLFMKEINEEFALLNTHQKLYSVLKPVLYVALVVSIFMIGKFNANTFIYFQF
jgi:alginate O-acetyltransferase complex protein AlgI